MAALTDATPETTDATSAPDELTNDPDVKYVRNDLGFIHSVTLEHFDEVLHITVGNGRQVILPGWEEVDEATARKEQPTLFGAHDPNVRMNVKEMQDLEAREAFEAKHRADSTPE